MYVYYIYMHIKKLYILSRETSQKCGPRHLSTVLCALPNLTPDSPPSHWCPGVLLSLFREVLIY